MTHLVQCFGAQEILAIEYAGRPVMLAGQLGAALGYAEPSRLARFVGGKWADDFVEGVDYYLLTNGELAAFKVMIGDNGTNRAVVDEHDTSERRVVDAKANRVLLLTESGAQLAAMLSRTPAGRAFRRWLVDELLPAWRTLTQAPPPALVDASPRELRLLAGAFTRNGQRQHAEVLLQRAAELLFGAPVVPDGGQRFEPVTRDEKRSAVRAALAAAPDLSDRELADVVGVSHTFVANLRREGVGFSWARVRRRLGLSQEQVAAEVGLHQSMISALERGHRAPSVAALQRLAEFYRLTPEETSQALGFGARRQ